jgi:predicted DNA repair protein MutK
MPPAFSSSKKVAVIAIFTSLIIATDYALAPALNVKLMDTLVFSSSFVFGFRIGASIAVFSELIWSIISPYGFFLPIIPFLVGGEILFVFAGYFASSLWKHDVVSPVALENVLFGGILAICAFIWDTETNIATGIIAGAHTLVELLGFEVAGIPFMVAHEVSDFIFGSTLAPVVIYYFSKHSGGIRRQKISTSPATEPIAGGK